MAYLFVYDHMKPAATDELLSRVNWRCAGLCSLKTRAAMGHGTCATGCIKTVTASMFTMEASALSL